MPQSLLNIERSEWQRPQCSTATSTSSVPRGPRSTSWRTIFCFAAGATHALTLMILLQVVVTGLRWNRKSLEDHQLDQDFISKMTSNSKGEAGGGTESSGHWISPLDAGLVAFSRSFLNLGLARIGSKSGLVSRANVSLYPCSRAIRSAASDSSWYFNC